MDETRTESHIWKMKELGVHIIASIYDFAATPVPEEMMRCLKYMEEMGAAVGDVSAPGQIPVEKMNEFLHILS